MYLEQTVLNYCVCCTVGFHCLKILSRRTTKNNLTKNCSVFALKKFTAITGCNIYQFRYIEPHMSSFEGKFFLP